MEEEEATNGLETRHGKIPLLLDVLGEARDDALCSMSIHTRTKKKTFPKFIHFTRPTVLSLLCTSIYTSIRLVFFFFFFLFFYFVLIAFSVVVVVVAGPRKYQRGRKRLLRGGSTRQRRSSLAQQQQQQQQSRRPFFKMC